MGGRTRPSQEAACGRRGSVAGRPACRWCGRIGDGCLRGRRRDRPSPRLRRTIGRNAGACREGHRPPTHRPIGPRRLCFGPWPAAPGDSRASRSSDGEAAPAFRRSSPIRQNRRHGEGSGCARRYGRWRDIGPGAGEPQGCAEARVASADDDYALAVHAVVGQNPRRHLAGPSVLAGPYPLQRSDARDEAFSPGDFGEEFIGKIDGPKRSRRSFFRAWPPLPSSALS